MSGAEAWILSKICRASFMEGLLCGVWETQLSPNLNHVNTTFSLPSISDFIAASAILTTRFCSSSTKPGSFHCSNSRSRKTLPVRSSSSTIPKEYTSHLWLGLMFSSDSGAWYTIMWPAPLDDDPIAPKGLEPNATSCWLLWFAITCLAEPFPLWVTSFRSSLSSPKSLIMASISEFSRMLPGLTLPCTCFFSWRKTNARATPFAIFNRISKDKFRGDEPDFPKP